MTRRGIKGVGFDSKMMWERFPVLTCCEPIKRDQRDGKVMFYYKFRKIPSGYYRVYRVGGATGRQGKALNECPHCHTAIGVFN